MLPNHHQHPQILFQQHPDGTSLRAEVPPFIPRSSGDGSQNPLPSYVTTCYPFVQEQQDSRNNFLSQQIHGNNSNPQRLAPPYNSQYFPLGFAIPPPPLGVIPSNFQQSSNMFTGNLADSNLVSAVYGDQRSTLFPNYTLHNKSDEQNYPGRKILRKNVGVQKEVETSDANNNDKDNKESPVMVDSCQQTDFPLSIACKSLTDRPSPLRKKKSRRRAVTLAANGVHDSSSDHADVDSDSGYYSPKHRFTHKVSGGTSTTELTREQPLLHQQPGSSQSSNTNLQHLLYIQHNNNMVPPTLLYQLHPQSPSNPYMGALSPHVTPPPQGLMGGGPLLISPPPTPMLNTLNGRNPGVIKPPSPMQMHSNMMWGTSQYYPNNFAPKILQPKQQLQNMGSHGTYKNHKGYRHKQQYPRNYNNYASGDAFNNRNSNQNVRMDQYGNNTNQQSQISPMLSDAQEFPGLGGSGLFQPQNGMSSALSYSNVVMGKTLPKAQGMVPVDSAEEKNAQKNRKRRKKAERASKAADEEYAEISKEHENIKKALKKTAANRNRPKTPMLDLGEIFNKLEQRGSSKQSRNVVRIGGGVALSVEDPGTKHDDQRSTNQMPVNMLDSTAPVQKRGKEREIPKIKKPSALKKVILKEREEKKENRMTQLTTQEIPETDVPHYPPAIVQALPAGIQDEQIEKKIAQLTLDNLPSTIPQIHSRRYREYCCQVLDKRIDETCTTILQKLVQFQDRLYQKDPMKAKIKRRLVMGLREVTKHLKLKKLKCVVISPNLEKIQSKGGLDDALQNILNMCEEQNVTYVFALGRKAMGRAVCKLVPVSIIGIFDYNGAEEQYKQLVELVAEAQNKYKEMVSIYQQEVNEVSTQSVQPVSNAGSKRFSHMGHSRNPSAASCVSFASFISEPISELNEASNWRVMMGADDSSLSPPPEKGSSSEEEEEDLKSRTASQGMSRKGSGSTVVDGKNLEVKITVEEALKEEEDRSSSSESPPKVLNKSFASTTSTLTNLNLPEREVASSSPSEGSSMQDRINLWLEDATRLQHDFNLSSPDTEHLPPVLEENLSEATSSGNEEEEEKKADCDVIINSEEQLTDDVAEKQDSDVAGTNCDVIIGDDCQLVVGDSEIENNDNAVDRDDFVNDCDVTNTSAVGHSDAVKFNKP